MPTFKIILQEQGATKAKKNVDGLGKSLGGITKKAGLMAAGLFAGKKAFDAVSASVQAAGKFEGVQAGFDNLRKKTGFSSAAFDKFNKALDGTIKSTDLMTMANNAMLLGITDNEDQMAQMFDTAQRLAKAVGEDAAFGVNSLVTGIGRQCLTSDSFISTKDGIKQIIDIKDGDIVLSRDDNGKIIETKVTHLLNNGIQKVYIVIFKDGKFIKSTSNHRYFTDNGWKYLSELGVGSKVFNIESQYSEIHSINEFSEEEVYDLSVPETANFFANGLCVHNSKLMLDNLGIMIDTQKAYDDYAATLGKTASQLDETERKQAFTNAALEEAERLAASLGEEQITLTDQFNQGKKAVADISVNMGQLLTPAVSFLATGFVHAAEAVAFFLGRLNDTKTAEAMQSTSLEKVNKALFDRRQELAKLAASMGALFADESTLDSRNRIVILETEIEKLQARHDLLSGMTEEERIQFAEKEAAHIKNMELQEQVHYAEDLQFTDRQVRHDFEMGAIKKIDDEKTKSRNKALKGIQLELNAAAEVHKQETKNAALGAKTASQGLKQSIGNASKKAVAELIASIFQNVPYPANIILAATAGGLANSIIDRNLDAHIPAFAEGGSFVTGGDQLIRVGDNSTGREMVNVVPLDAAGEPTGGGGMINVNITGNVMSENYTEDIIIPHIKSALRRGEAIS